MHNNYYFLRQLSAELKNRLIDCVVSECYSQHKDELIIRFETTQKPFFIKARLQSDFCCLSFPSNFNRARKNSVDLFGDLIGQRVTEVYQYNNERCFSLHFTDDFVLLFKLHGNRANLVLFRQNKALALFRNHLSADYKIVLTELDKEIDFSRDAFINNQANLKQHCFTFGKVVWKYLEQNHFDTLALDGKWSTIQSLLQYLDQPEYYLTLIENQLVFSLIDIGSVEKQYTNAIEAVNEFFIQYAIRSGFQQEKLQALAKLRTQVKNTEAYLPRRHKSYVRLRRIIITRCSRSINGEPSSS